MKKIGYARVSTLKQDLSSQVEILKEEGCTKIFKEKFTGTKADRPEFKKALDALEPGATLVVTKLDRLARSATDAIQTVRSLVDRGIKVHILNMGLADNTPTGKLMLTIMSGFAEFERDMIVERTQSGKEFAKSRNPDFKEGRPKTPRKKLAHAMKLLEEHTYKEVVEMTGISKSTLIREKKRLEALEKLANEK